MYDPLDRLVLQQDGKMRQNNKWLYTKYDAFDRPTETGFYATTQLQSDLQAIFNAKITYDGATTGFANLPNNNTELLTQTTYDPTGFKGQVNTFTEKILFPNGDLTAYNNVLAQAGNASSITTNQIVTTYTYNNKYHVIAKNQSNHLGGTTTGDYANYTNYTYNNFDLVTTQNQTHQVSLAGATLLSLTKNLYYDGANRLREIHNNGTITAHHNYNPIGQLTEKKLHRLGGSTSNNFLQTIDYRYNQRGWLTQINQIALGASGDLNSDAFAETITYEANGNIAGTELKNAYPDGSNAYNATNLQASYAYDNLNRLLTATTNLTSPATGNYSEAFSYDQAGNIVSLQRNGKLSSTTTGLIDNLQYSYPTNSNQLKAVEDAVTTATTEANDFEEQTHLATEYFYDANGNMFLDGNKKMLVAYNHLNLPTLVFYPQDGKFIMWVYTATGTKLQKYVCSTNPKNVWDQAINIANNNNALQNPHVQYGKRFANISTRRTAANQTLTPIELYQHVQDTIALVRSQAIPTTSTGTYQEPQSLMDLVGTPQAQAAVTCYKHDYIGNIEYQNNTLEAYYTEEGRINYAQGSRTEYNIKDHLGNTRVCFTPPATGNAPKILQQTNYYAFGLPIGNLSRTYPLTTGGAFALEDKYQYNQKEMNNDFGLLWNDYGARWYNPQLAIWHQIDPLAEKYAAWSGYNYVGDNPIKHIDPDGRSGELSIVGNKVIVSSNLILYGGKASPTLANIEAAKIQKAWNAAKGTTKINGKTYKVEFQVKGEYRDAGSNGPSNLPEEIIFNKSYKNNYIRVEELTDNIRDKRTSYVEKKGNSGFWSAKQLNSEGSTTSAHEFGHLLGLKHIANTEPCCIDPPNIMLTEANDRQVSTDYQIKEEDGTILLDKTERRVTQDDINNLGIQNLNFVNGKATIGNLSNEYHEE